MAKANGNANVTIRDVPVGGSNSQRYGGHADDSRRHQTLRQERWKRGRCDNNHQAKLDRITAS
jgi:hypothetical protein